MQRTPRLRLGSNPGVIGAGSLIRSVRRHYAPRFAMLKQRFSWISVQAMLVACLGAVVAMQREVGGSESMRYRGFPFAWLAQTDVVGVEYYRWPGLVADIIIWCAVIAAVGLLTQRLTRRPPSGGRRIHEDTHAA